MWYKSDWMATLDRVCQEVLSGNFKLIRDTKVTFKLVRECQQTGIEREEYGE